MQPQYIPTAHNFKDITGQRFTRLVALRPVGRKNNQVLWLCRCDCGNEITVSGVNLRTKETKSCGCLKLDTAGDARRTHGLTGSRIYDTWCDIKKRCCDPNSTAYSNYGGRGIAVYAGWLHDAQAFVDYVSALRHYGEKGYSLDRIDNNGNYEPGNLRWATKSEQAFNRRPRKK
jgi:hypothetical protein